MGKFSQSLVESLQQGAGAIFAAEFDDALLDLEGWKNPRFVGSKLTGKSINTYSLSETSSQDYKGQKVDFSTGASGSITFTDTINHSGNPRNRFIFTIGGKSVTIHAGISQHLINPFNIPNRPQFDTNGSNLATLASNLKTVLDAQGFDLQTGVDGTGLLSITCSKEAGKFGNNAIKVKDKIAGSTGKIIANTTIVQTTGGSNQWLWGGDKSYGLNPVINNETTAIYIANSVVGGTEDKQFATEKILIVNTEDNTVKIIDRETEPYDSFHRFITNDFPTGGKLNIKILDPSIQSNLEGNYFCKMNKGWLLSTFKYHDYVNYNGGGNIWGNPLELFDNSELGNTGTTVIDNALGLNVNRLAFKFGRKTEAPTVTLNAQGLNNGTVAPFPIADFSPNYTKAEITPNKFTAEYYSGSFSFPSINTGYDGAFFSASRFILNDTVQFLNKNFKKTEVHLTINKGTKNLSPGFNDERSIGTFELDRGYGDAAAISKNDHTEGNPLLTPKSHYIGHNTPIHPIMQLKGGFNFTPTIPPIKNNNTKHGAMVQIAGGNYFAQLNHIRDTYWVGNEDKLIPYSGSAAFELSFLDKDHTLIVDVDKDKELFDGIGEKGVVLIPEFLHNTIKSNLAYYLKKAGIIDNAPTTQV